VENWALVVEDDADSREALIELLNSSGFAALGAAGVEEALTVMAETPPSLVISDILLGDREGGELFDIAQQLLGSHAPPFVFVSGMPASQTTVRASVPFFRKPMDLEALLEHVAKHCQPVKRTRSAF
jgi:two-component system response regulator FlrC